MRPTWRPGKQPDTVVSDVPSSDITGDGRDLQLSREYYGGYLVAESIAPENVGPISATLDLLEEGKKLVEWLDRLTARAEKEAKENAFITLREAYAADVKNFRATAKGMRAAIAKAGKNRRQYDHIEIHRRRSGRLPGAMQRHADRRPRAALSP